MSACPQRIPKAKTKTKDNSLFLITVACLSMKKTKNKKNKIYNLLIVIKSYTDRIKNKMCQRIDKTYILS